MIEVTTGTSSLSKAGTGDVLLGMIVALRAQGLEAVDACTVATYLHGKSGQFWENEGNDYLSMRPTDLINCLPKVIKLIRNSSK